MYHGSVRKSLQVFTRDVTRIFRARRTWVIVVGVILTPALYAWFNINAFWDPYANTGNIGVAVCDAFLREGARAVIATDMRVDDADAITADIESRHGSGRFRLVQQDVTAEGDWATLVESVLGEFGVIDVLVNNAG